MELLYLIEKIRNPILDVFFSLITYLGHELVVIGVICVLLWCVDKKFAYRLGFIFFISGLGTQALKITFRVPRPWVLDPEFSPVESAKPAATGYSFPSGHAQGSTALFAPIAGRAKNKCVKSICVLLFLLVCFSRLYLGVHTLKDVAVGMALSLAAASAVIPLMRMLERSNSRDVLVAAALGIVSLCVMIYSIVLYNCGVINEYKMAADCCKSSASGLAFAIGWLLDRKYIKFDVSCDRRWHQVVKILIGLAGALVFKEGIKVLFGVSLAVDIIRYFLVVLWVLAIFPFIWSKIPFSKRRISLNRMLSLR